MFNDTDFTIPIKEAKMNILISVLAFSLNIWWNNKQEVKKRKIEIFRTLMTTRAEGLSRLHVEALNKIDIEFYGDEKVIDSWKTYLNHLYSYNTPGQKTEYDDKIWQDKKSEFLCDLLYEMANILGYKFNKADIKRDFYRPKAFNDIEEDAMIVRKGLVDIFKNNKLFPIFAVVTPAKEEPPKIENTEIKGREDVKTPHWLILGKKGLDTGLRRYDGCIRT